MAYKWLTPILVRTNFLTKFVILLQLLLLIAILNEHSSSIRLHFVAHIDTSDSPSNPFFRRRVTLLVPRLLVILKSRRRCRNSDLYFTFHGTSLQLLALLSYPIWVSKALCLLPNLEENAAITTVQTCKKVSRHGAEVKYATLELVSYFDLYLPLVLNDLQSLSSCHE